MSTGRNSLFDLLFHLQEAQSAKAETERVTRLAEAEKERSLELTKQLTEFSKKQDEIRENQALLETYNQTLADKDMWVL